MLTWTYSSYHLPGRMESATLQVQRDAEHEYCGYQVIEAETPCIVIQNSTRMKHPKGEKESKSGRSQLQGRSQGRYKWHMHVSVREEATTKDICGWHYIVEYPSNVQLTLRLVPQIEQCRFLDTSHCNITVHEFCNTTQHNAVWYSMQQTTFHHAQKAAARQHDPPPHTKTES